MSKRARRVCCGRYVLYSRYKDEFYTQLRDIENELSHYRAFFSGKTVFCNCDDPFKSNFVKYFSTIT